MRSLVARQRAAVVEQLPGVRDVRLGLLQRGHVEEDEGLAEVMVGFGGRAGR